MEFLKNIKSEVLKRRYTTGAILISVVVIAIIIGSRPDVKTESDVTSKPVVSTITAAEYSGTQDFSTVGTVRAFTEASVTSETGGRVVSVNALLGQSVPASFIIATLENASERAAVLQAEGAYEAALAASAQGNISVSEASTALVAAQNSAVSTILSSYNTVTGIVRNDVDDFFSNPDSQVPGLKIDGQGMTLAINNDRVQLQSSLAEWQTRSGSLTANSNLDTELSFARTQTEKTISLVDTFITLFNSENADSSYTTAELKTFSVSFTALRGTLLGVKSSIDAAEAGLNAARDTVRRAEIASSGGVSSAADAQVKQALGVLRAAQANLSKTILRSPIAGTVNSLPVRTGDYVGPQTVVAEIANNGALQVVIYVGEKERDAFTVGELVSIDNTFEGTVTEIAPAVDAETGKTEVRIAIESNDIQNGDTVTVSKLIEQSSESKIVVVPLSAVKFESEDGFMFVVENGRLVMRPVELGVVRGGSIEITEGISITEAFVKDARGLVEGTEVDIMN